MATNGGKKLSWLQQMVVTNLGNKRWQLTMARNYHGGNKLWQQMMATHGGNKWWQEMIMAAKNGGKKSWQQMI